MHFLFEAPHLIEKNSACETRIRKNIFAVSQKYVYTFQNQNFELLNDATTF